MRSFRPILFTVALLILTGCAPTGPFTAYLAAKDPFKADQTKYFSDSIKLKDFPFLNPGFGFFEIHAIKKNTQQLWYLRTCYFAGKWLFAEKLRFVIDGEVITFESQPNPIHEVGKGGTTNIFEENQFIVSEQFLRKFGKATTAAVRLEGQHYYVERILTVDDISNINWFTEYVEGQFAPGS